MAAKSEKTEFRNQDGVVLSARLEKADTLAEGGPIALFAHCFTCSKDVLAASRIAKSLTKQGISVLRFDFTGLGNSDGDFANTDFSSNLDDLQAAYDFLEQEYRAPELLIGHSLGGAAALAAAPTLEALKGVVCIGSPSDPKHVVHQFDEKIDEIRETGCAVVDLGGRPFTIKKQFIDDLDAHNQEHKIAKLGCALLIFHSPIDDVVSIKNAQEIYQQAKHPKSFVSLDGADHLLTKPEDASYVAEVIAAWAMRYLS